MIDIFYEFDDPDIENYAGDTRSYTCTTHTDTVISKFQSTSDKLLLVSKITIWKASLKKGHRLLSLKTPTKSFFEDSLSNPAQKKHCLVSGMTPNFTLRNIFLSLCTNVSRKINAFDRITNFMLYEKRRLIIEAFIELQFSDCPFIWVFRSRTLNNKIDHLHERALKIAYSDYKSPFNKLLRKNNTCTIHHRKIQSLLIEIYNFWTGYLQV